MSFGGGKRRGLFERSARWLQVGVIFSPPSLTVRLVRLSNVTRGKNIRPPISVQPGIKGAAFSVSKIGYGICGLAGEERDDGLAPVNEWEREWRPLDKPQDWLGKE